MVSFPAVSPPRPYTPPSPHPYAPHAHPISFFWIVSYTLRRILFPLCTTKPHYFHINVFKLFLSKIFFLSFFLSFSKFLFFARSLRLFRSFLFFYPFLTTFKLASFHLHHIFKDALRIRIYILLSQGRLNPENIRIYFVLLQFYVSTPLQRYFLFVIV